MVDTSPRWVARIVPAPGTDVDALLATPFGLDVWERHANELVVAAADTQLAEIERRRLATVERICTVAAYLRRVPGPGTEKPEEKR